MNGKYPRLLPFVFELPCPFEHRTEDRRNYAKVRLLIEEDGLPGLDDDSPRPRLRCPPSRMVFPDLPSVAWVVTEFARPARVAEARWWVERTEVAAESI